MSYVCIISKKERKSRAADDPTVPAFTIFHHAVNQHYFERIQYLRLM